MRLCKVVGHVVATAKHPALQGRRIMVVAQGRGDPGVAAQLAVDGVGSGIGSEVLVTESGAAAAKLLGLPYPPVRSVIVGIVD